MNYTRSVKYIFENTSWWMILLIGLLCNIIPIVGTMVFIGYLVLNVTDFHKTKQDQLKNFDINLLGDYLKSGVWVFVAMFLPIFAYFIVFGVIFSGSLGLSAATKHHGVFPLIGLIMVPLHFIAMVLISLLIVPFSLGASFGQSLASAFNKNFVIDFVKKMWVEMIIACLFTWIVSAMAAIAGLVLCCVGAYLSIPFMFLVQWHLYWQLYEEYLNRGGMAVAMKQ